MATLVPRMGSHEGSNPGQTWDHDLCAKRRGKPPTTAVSTTGDPLDEARPHACKLRARQSARNSRTLERNPPTRLSKNATPATRSRNDREVTAYACW